MKLLIAGISAVTALAALAVVLLGNPPAIGPEPIAYGRDRCDRCRMHLAQPGYAGELRDAKGRLTRYDDLGCMLVAMWRRHAEFPGAWAESHDGQGFVALTAAWFVLAEGQKTPMGYGVVAFSTEAAARAWAAEHGGEVGRLEDVLRDTTRFQREHAHNEVEP